MVHEHACPAQAEALRRRVLDLFEQPLKEIAARELFRFIWAQREKDLTKHSMKEMCKVLQVSEAGYYKWLRTRSQPYKYDELLAKIRQIRIKSKVWCEFPHDRYGHRQCLRNELS